MCVCCRSFVSQASNIVPYFWIFGWWACNKLIWPYINLNSVFQTKNCTSLQLPLKITCILSLILSKIYQISEIPKIISLYTWNTDNNTKENRIAQNFMQSFRISTAFLAYKISRKHISLISKHDFTLGMHLCFHSIYDRALVHTYYVLYVSLAYSKN